MSGNKKGGGGGEEEKQKIGGIEFIDWVKNYNTALRELVDGTPVSDIQAPPPLMNALSRENQLLFSKSLSAPSWALAKYYYDGDALDAINETKRLISQLAARAQADHAARNFTIPPRPKRIRQSAVGNLGHPHVFYGSSDDDDDDDDDIAAAAVGGGGYGAAAALTSDAGQAMDNVNETKYAALNADKKGGRRRRKKTRKKRKTTRKRKTRKQVKKRQRKKKRRRRKRKMKGGLLKLNSGSR